MKKLMFVVNVDWFFMSHRMPIALAAMQRGYEVHVACAFTGKEDYLKSLGFLLHEVNFSRSGKGIFKEIKTIVILRRLFRIIKPDIVHAVTIKPVIYSGIVSKGLKIRMVAAISGLGSVFVAEGIKAKIQKYIVVNLYKISLGSPYIKVIFQNTSDRSILCRYVSLKPSQCEMIRGSGVDLNIYRASPEPEGTPVVVMASRLLREKGVYEYVTAAKNIKEKGREVRFLLVGDPDPGNPSSVLASDLMQWKKENYVEIEGFQADIAGIFSRANLVVFPSFYGEGIPKVLIEAAACARAIVTTDNPGCAEAIINGETGLIVPVKNIVALEAAVEYLIEENVERKRLGARGRELAEKEYDIDKVIQQHLCIYDALGKIT